MDDNTFFERYIQHGWHLVPIERGHKAPRGDRWNDRGAPGLPVGWVGGAGLAHAYSGTCAVDIDQLAAARQYLALAYQIDLDRYLGALDRVQIVSGRPDRAKLLYRLPETCLFLKPVTKAVTLNGRHILQFRCATRAGRTVQDVLPPSIHPDTGQPYTWVGNWHELPELPAQRWALWQSLTNRTARKARGDMPDVSLGDIEQALAVLDPDLVRDQWIEIGMALHSTGEDLYGEFDAWSARGAKYAGSAETEAVWDSFHAMDDEGITLRTLFWRAREAQRAQGFEAYFQEVEQVPGAVSAPEQGSGPVQRLATFDELLEMARDLTPGVNIHGLLAQAVMLTPTEQDQLIAEINTRTTLNRSAIRQELAQLTRRARQARAEALGGLEQGPNFPLTNSDTGRPLDHVDNLRALCEWANVSVRYNEMTHEIEINAGHPWAIDDWRNEQLYWIRDQMVRWGMPYTRSIEHVKTLALNHAYHPARALLDGGRWDGVSRWRKLCETIKTTHPQHRDLYLRKWFLSGVAAVRGWARGVPPRGVLVSSGAQAQGKTSWLRYITPRGLFGEGLMLDPANKDSLKQAVSWWVVELGELDSTFSKADISRLKAHISKGSDELRLPYAASESRWPRRTIYAGTVNEREFLADQTGNTRFWPIETTGFDLDGARALWESGEIIQVWLEVETWYKAGENWWLDSKQLQALEEHNEEFRERSSIEDLLEHVYLWDRPQGEWTWKTPTEILQDCNQVLRGAGPGYQGSERTHFRRALVRLTGMPQAVRGWVKGLQARRWLVPPKRFEVVLGGKE